jgi:hypothetical protein
MFLPLVNLIRPSPWQRSIGFLHGSASMFTTIVVAYTSMMMPKMHKYVAGWA